MGKAYDTHLKIPLVSHNKVIRIVTGVPPRTSVHQIYIEQNIVPVKRLYTCNVTLFMYTTGKKYGIFFISSIFCILWGV